MIGVNDPCPCGSRLKFKKCCKRYHDGLAAPEALSLMKSRYSAYAAGAAGYIMQTTHASHPDRDKEPQAWRAEILHFCKTAGFLGLEILAFEPGESEAFVTFRAKLKSGDFIEKSRFLKENGRWYYESGVFS